MICTLEIMFCNIVPKLLRDVGSLAKFSQQGLETLNDNITKHYVTLVERT